MRARHQQRWWGRQRSAEKRNPEQALGTGRSRPPVRIGLQRTDYKTLMPLSVVLITKNAATQIDACLASASFADEIVVVDSGSTDETVKIARKHGARVIEREWTGYGPQKQFAVESATHDWVLCLDADERVSPQLKDTILRELPL